jgi:hypothetical protein
MAKLNFSIANLEDKRAAAFLAEGDISKAVEILNGAEDVGKHLRLMLATMLSGSSPNGIRLRCQSAFGKRGARGKPARGLEKIFRYAEAVEALLPGATVTAAREAVAKEFHVSPETVETAHLKWLLMKREHGAIS